MASIFGCASLTQLDCWCAAMWELFVLDLCDGEMPLMKVDERGRQLLCPKHKLCAGRLYDASVKSRIFLSAALPTQITLLDTDGRMRYVLNGTAPHKQAVMKSLKVTFSSEVDAVHVGFAYAMIQNTHLMVPQPSPSHRTRDGCHIACSPLWISCLAVVREPMILSSLELVGTPV